MSGSAFHAEATIAGSMGSVWAAWMASVSIPSRSPIVAKAIAVDAVPADQEVMPFAHRRADHGLHRGRARAGDEGELPVAADAGDAEQLLADPREHLGVLGLAVAQVRAATARWTTVADYRGPGVEQYPLAMMPACAVQVRSPSSRSRTVPRFGRVGRAEDRAGSNDPGWRRR